MRNTRIKYLIALLAALASSAIFAPVASATNSHQDHQGACARSTTSISQGVGDLRYNGVLGQFAADMGIIGLNGSITYQMDNQLVVATVVHAVTTHNHGCDGHGHTFDAGLRTVYAGEKVIVKRPAKFDKSIVCGHPSSRCMRATFRTCTALPGSCWNENNGCMLVSIWIKKTPKHHRHHKPKPKPQSPPPPPPSNNVCSNNANGNNNSQGGNCNTNICVGTSACSVTPPSGCASNCTPPPPRHSCTVTVGPLQKDERTYDFTATADGPVTLVSWSFSDGNSAVGNPVEWTFPDSAAGTTVSATATVSFSDGASSATCTGTGTIPPMPPDGNPGPPPPPTY